MMTVRRKDTFIVQILFFRDRPLRDGSTITISVHYNSHRADIYYNSGLRRYEWHVRPSNSTATDPNPFEGIDGNTEVAQREMNYITGCVWSIVNEADNASDWMWPLEMWFGFNESVMANALANMKEASKKEKGEE